MDYKVEHIEQDDQGEFFLFQNEEKIGQITYEKFKSGRLIIQHIEVIELLSGLGLAKVLLDSLVYYARENSLKLRSICPYAKKMFIENPNEYRDVLA